LCVRENFVGDDVGEVMMGFYDMNLGVVKTQELTQNVKVQLKSSSDI
jgi:hypothetical protein